MPSPHITWCGVWYNKFNLTGMMFAFLWSNDSNPDVPRVGNKRGPRNDAEVDNESERLIEQVIPTRGKLMTEVHVADQKCTEIAHVLAV